MKFQKFPAVAALILSSLPAFAVEGTHTGGGGDASEARVNEIRVDLLKWIADEKDQGLELPSPLSHAQYRAAMNAVLAQNAVVVAFSDAPVTVAGKEKTCVGSVVDSRLHIDCNISRFAATSPAGQYRLVHHEYAGLAGVEQNDGAASDYRVSNQITEFLVQETVLKLGVRPAKAESSNWVGKYTLRGATGNRAEDCKPSITIESYEYYPEPGSTQPAEGLKVKKLEELDGYEPFNFEPNQTFKKNAGCDPTSFSLIGTPGYESVTRTQGSDTFVRRTKTTNIDCFTLWPDFLAPRKSFVTLTWIKKLPNGDVQLTKQSTKPDSKQIGSLMNCRYSRAN